MKKIIKWGFCLLLVSVMLFAFAGCSPADDEGEVNDLEDEKRKQKKK